MPDQNRLPVGAEGHRWDKKPALQTRPPHRLWQRIDDDGLLADSHVGDGNIPESYLLAGDGYVRVIAHGEHSFSVRAERDHINGCIMLKPTCRDDGRALTVPVSGPDAEVQPDGVRQRVILQSHGLRQELRGANHSHILLSVGEVTLE